MPDQPTPALWPTAYQAIMAGQSPVIPGAVEQDQLAETDQKPEAVDHPAHYNAHPSGIECIDVVEHMGFNVGNAMKYLWRADEKGRALEDLKKAAWYVQREIEKRERAS